MRIRNEQCVYEFMEEKTTLDLSSEHDLSFVQSIMFNVRDRGLHRKQIPQNISDAHKPLSQAAASAQSQGSKHNLWNPSYTNAK